MLRILLVILLALPAGVVAQSFPSKSVRLIVTYAPGGSSDLMARVLGISAR
jgi:tripartite-type tricarboxylate transporter receptor subunit TctC